MENKTGINMGVIKQKNRASILHLLRDNGAMPRKDIAKSVQLTPAAVTMIVNEMIEEGVIREIGELEEDDKRAGRKKILIDINYDLSYVIGISIESEICSIGVGNLKGDIISDICINIDKTLSPEETLKNIANECIKLLWKDNILKERVLAVGVGIIGPVDAREGISKHAYGLWKSEVRVREILEQQLNINVVVDNNVRTLAIAEMDRKKLQNIKNMLFVKYGPGIGSAVVINREIYSGSNNVAAELGHTIVEPGGEACRCGKFGCLETLASTEAIRKKLRNIFSKEKTPIIYEVCGGDLSNLSTNNIIKGINLDDKDVINIVRDAATYMALSISNEVTIFDPEKLVLYGQMFKNKIFMDRFKEELKKNIVGRDLKDTISLSDLNSESVYIGGIALAIREFFFNTGAMS